MSAGKVPKSAEKSPNLKGGSRKGIPNKTTKTLKEMILGALDKAGGLDYLHRQAEENPGPFMTLVGKVLPTTLTGDPENPVVIRSIERRLVRASFDQVNEVIAHCVRPNPDDRDG